ncbi:hypothetical protein HPP92_013205 [Vanilla planifolia]|uniref:Uncharacterized protein n=1 Tax=Vanilla planifolia TaxID=51239 RepID=A0A835QWL6_VANPL|nr:hypothetical protein HPP92_013205 [Vanilla planifolia]
MVDLIEVVSTKEDATRDNDVKNGNTKPKMKSPYRSWLLKMNYNGKCTHESRDREKDIAGPVADISINSIMNQNLVTRKRGHHRSKGKRSTVL